MYDTLRTRLLERVVLHTRGLAKLACYDLHIYSMDANWHLKFHIE